MQSGQETGVTAIALSAPSSFMQGDDAVNQERRFEMAEAGPPPTLQRPSESGHFAARARVQRTDAAAMIIASAFRSMTGALRTLLTHAVRREQQRATRDALMPCSDRVLADLGIEREHIPLVAKGINPAEHQPGRAHFNAGGPPHAPASMWRARPDASDGGCIASSMRIAIANSTRSGCGAPTSLSSRASTRSSVGRPDHGRRPPAQAPAVGEIHGLELELQGARRGSLWRTRLVGSTGLESLTERGERPAFPTASPRGKVRPTAGRY
jgi:uncharacterized protein YjiS (DUF1127 family)